MKQKQRLCLLLSSFALIIVCGIYVQPAQAQEGVGGAVQTNGEIGFYKDDEPVTSSSSTTPSSSSPSSSAPPKSSSSTGTSGTVTKPTGNYPSTGELIKKSLSLSGIALVLLAFLLFLFKRKKKEVGE